MVQKILLFEKQERNNHKLMLVCYWCKLIALTHCQAIAFPSVSITTLLRAQGNTLCLLARLCNINST